jgi:Flp pilus assembly pilin Flp
MNIFFKRFWNDEQGQDLIEYTLMLAFVALASAALFSSAGASINSIWSKTNSQLSNAASGSKGLRAQMLVEAAAGRVGSTNPLLMWSCRPYFCRRHRLGQSPYEDIL